MLSILKITKGHDFVKTIGRVVFLGLCTLTDGALFFY